MKFNEHFPVQRPKNTLALRSPWLWVSIAMISLGSLLIVTLSQSVPKVNYETYPNASHTSKIKYWWPFQAVDTMKYSRDLAREKLNDEEFINIIELQVRQIASIGATHIALATPYDEEFYPFLKRWVGSARKYDLHVWFRGNWSGWEGWFDYPQISREEHISKSVNFIKSHPDIFQSGDYFTACPECENGLEGDPRKSGNFGEYRRYFIEEYQRLQEAFRSIDTNVNTTLLSMNGDVAKAVMDAQTTSQLGGVVTIDHYVGSSQKYRSDIRQIARDANGTVVLGEFGAPIPDIHGRMDEDEQAMWIREVLNELKYEPDIQGMSYWVNWGGSTQLWNNGPEERKAVAAVRDIFLPPTLRIRLVDEYGSAVSGAQIHTKFHVVTTDENGLSEIPTYPQFKLVIEKPGFNSTTATQEIIDNSDTSEDGYHSVTLTRQYSNIFDKLIRMVIR